MTLESGTFTSVSALAVLNLDGNYLETLSYNHIVPLMDNLVNASSLLSVRGKFATLGCFIDRLMFFEWFDLRLGHFTERESSKVERGHFTE